MRLVRRHRLVRLFALALALWLGADALSHGACAHDVIKFTRAGDSGVTTTSSPDKSTDRDDVNHCSCHWQCIAALSLVPTGFVFSIPHFFTAPLLVPQTVERNVERPPQHR